MYARRSRLSTRKQMDLLRMFVAGATARATAAIVAVHRNTATSFFMRLRHLIAGKLPSYEFSGEVEADESYFGRIRKGRRDRGASGKVTAFGLLKRGRKGFHCHYSQRKYRTPATDHREKGDTRQHCLHRLVQGL
jgi:transposase